MNSYIDIKTGPKMAEHRSISEPPKIADDSEALAETARLSQFVASWPNLPPAAYSTQLREEVPAIENIRNGENDVAETFCILLLCSRSSE